MSTGRRPEVSRDGGHPITPARASQEKILNVRIFLSIRKVMLYPSISPTAQLRV
jgi:hypothetical protein